MKPFRTLLIGTFLLAAAFPPAQADTAITVDFFYDALEPHGEWLEVADYGYAWHPREVTEEWRPYTQGSWVYTDAGWTWISDEPHGWATYHYGRWVMAEPVGWVWVPDVEWGPAWVSWRRSETHVGWAPLPPEASFRRTVGFSNWVDSYYDIGPASYSFVETRNLGAPRLATVIVEPQRNVTIINETRNITKITYVNDVIVNEGPEYEVVSRVSAQPIRRLRLERRVDLGTDIRTVRTEQFRPAVEGDSLRVMAPMLQAGGGAPKRLGKKVANVQINRGWKNAGPPAQVEKLRAKVKAEGKPPADLPPQPKFETAQQRATRDPQAAAAVEPKTEPGTPGTDPAAPPATAGKPPMKDKAPGVAGRAAVGQPGTELDPATTDPTKATAPIDPNAPPAGTAGKAPMKGRPKAPGAAGRAGVAKPDPNAPLPDPATVDPTTPPADPAKADRPGKAGKGRGEPPRGKNAPVPTETTPAESAPETDAPAPKGARGKINQKPGAAKRDNRPAPAPATESSNPPPADAPPATENPDPAKTPDKVEQPKPRTVEDAAPAADAPADRSKAGRGNPGRPGAGRDAAPGRRGPDPAPAENAAPGAPGRDAAAQRRLDREGAPKKRDRKEPAETPAGTEEPVPDRL